MTLSQLTIEAQLVLDELWGQDLLPFQLTARQVKQLGQNECTICFHDSRLYSADVAWSERDPFKDAFRNAILARVQRLDGPPEVWAEQRQDRGV